MGETFARLDAIGLVCRGNNLHEFARRTIEKPQNTSFGNDSDLADFNNLPQEFRQRLWGRQPVHDIEDLYQRFTCNLIRVLQVQRYGQTKRPLFFPFVFLSLDASTQQRQSEFLADLFCSV